MWLSILFWAYYWIVQRLPMSADETFFTHMIWLMHQGQRQYVDFYSYHLPTYFSFAADLTPSEGLGFIWWLRGLSLIVLGCYALMLRPALWPAMLLFAVLGRMAEIRPDTIGMLILNCSWFLILKDRRFIIPAFALGLCATLFSARASLMLPWFAGLCFYLVRPRVWALVAVVGAAGALIGLLALVRPHEFMLVARMVYLEPLAILPRKPMPLRFLDPARLALVFATLTAMVNCLRKYRADQGDYRSLVIAVACVGQMFLILADPAPNVYVYGWAMVPVLKGLPGTDGQQIRASIAAALGLIGLSLTYPVWHGGRQRVDSYARLTFERRMDVSRLPADKLVPLLFDSHALWNQIAIREALCSKLRGEALAYFWYQPICLRDAAFEWVGLSWTPDMLAVTAFKKRPALIVWGQRPLRPARLPPDYETRDGFALRVEARKTPAL